MIKYRILNSNIVKRAVALAASVVVLFSFAVPSYAYTSDSYAGVSDARTVYERESFRLAYIERGFPSDYADRLAELSLAHPNWSFEPLFVSGMEPAYTFEYIIARETEDPETNLVFPSEEYSDYFKESSSPSYDSGWYPASEDAVRYFIDPRNFLNERDIFQFEDVSYYDRDYRAGVEGVLRGTFMERLTLENGQALIDYLLEIGSEMSVSPVHIASRMRQEQGVENTSGMISGGCGDLLLYFYNNGIQYTPDGKLVNTPSAGYTSEELLSYNGYYNFFNMGATGTGLFSIYLSAMKRARTGTPEMSEEWGTASWDAMYKSIYGGVYSLKEKYVDDYQNTMYLQKFNVDPRSSRNFWGQYMQNIGAALSEGRSTYESYRDAGILESEFVFLIPVYSGMPSVSPDPANGTAPYSSSQGYITYHTRSDYPYGQNRENSETRLSVDTAQMGEMRVQGWSVHTYGTSWYELSIDGGAFERINSYPRADVREKWAEKYPLSYDVNGYLAYIDTASLPRGRHSAVVRARTLYGSYYEVAYIEFETGALVGDLDGDGALGTSDLTLLLRYLSGYEVELRGDADLNSDGRINNRDLLMLIGILNGR